MEYFNHYVSNTVAGSGNQLYFSLKEGEIRTGRIFYKISVAGEFNYSLLFTNVIDSTFSDGSFCHGGLICDGWKIHSAKIGKCKELPKGKDPSEMTDADTAVADLTEISFDGKVEKNVMPGEFFSSDPVRLSFSKGEYLCLEMTFSGSMIPYHEESLLPVFTKTEDGWKYDRRMPFASMVGCDRKVKGKIAYLGDSITQGIGTPKNAYTHWNALLSEKLGEDYAFWNLGLGYGRASDAALDASWLYKAKKNDTVFVCFGVNDILQGHTEEKIKADLTRIVKLLKQAGKKVILQTVPPFDYTGENIEKWKNVNAYVKTVLKEKADALFDNGPVLGSREKPEVTVYGGHPNEEGCKAWADALFNEVNGIVKKEV